MGNPDLRSEAVRLGPWHYPLRLGSVEVPLGKSSRERLLRGHAEVRKRILVDSLLRCYSMRGKRVLDLGCAGGYWGGFYAQNGATYYLGVDGRRHVVEQGNLYWGTNQFLPVGQYEFMFGDVMETSSWTAIRERGPFDFCLLAGLLYHLPAPYRVLRRAIEVAGEALVVDTQTHHKKDRPSIKHKLLRFGRLPRHERAIRPHRDMLMEALRAAFNRCIDLSEGVEVTDERWPSGKTYHGGRRLAVLALK